MSQIDCWGAMRARAAWVRYPWARLERLNAQIRSFSGKGGAESSHRD